MSKRALIFVGTTVLCVLLAGGYVAQAVLQARSQERTKASASFHGVPDAKAGQVDVLVRRADPKNSQTTNPAVSLLSIAGGKTTTMATGLKCRRVYFAGGRGLCLIEDRTGLSYKAVVLDRQLKTIDSFVLTGIPSRARVSSSGRWGSLTVFRSGDSYASPGQFSTQTLIVDMRTGKPYVDLERFTLYKDGKKIDAPDINLWGVTFAKDDDTFYATLRTGGSTYLMKGSISKRTATALRTNVECPSLSPDGTRIAYKKLVGGNGHWNIHVITLADMSDHAVADTHVVDDQVEWLDDQTLLYNRDGAVWKTPADGSGAAAVFVRGAQSPSVVRGDGDGDGGDQGL